MSLNLKSISELQTLANSDDISAQISALSATDVTSYIEVSYKNPSLALSSYKFDFTKFMRFIINALTDLSTAFDDYITKREYILSTEARFSDLSDFFLPNNYVTLNGPDLTITSKKVFNADCSFSNITVITSADIWYLTNKQMNSNDGTINALSTNALTCSDNTADLTAQYALWN